MFKHWYYILNNLLLLKPNFFCYLIILIAYGLLFIGIKCILQKKKNIINKANNNDYIAIYKLLDYYFTYNIYAEIFLLIILLIFSTGFLLLLRIFNLGKIFSLWSIFSIINDINPVFILLMLFYMITIIYFFKVSSTIIKDIYFKIYLYLFQNKYYYDFIYYINDKGVTFSLNIITKLSSLFGILLDPENSRILKLMLKYDADARSTKFILFMIALVKKKIAVKSLLVLLYSFLLEYNIEFKLRCFIEKWPLIMLYIILLYDLNQEEINYTYYGLLIFLIISLYRRFRTFVGQLDMFELDGILARYYYEKNKHIAFKEKNRNEINFEFMDYQTLGIYEGIDRIKDYFNRGYIVDYVDIKFKMSYEPYSVRFIFIGIIIFYYMFCYNVNFIYGLIISIPLLLSIIIYEYAYYDRKNIKNKLKYILSYKMFLIISIMIGIKIYLTRHTLYLFTDIIWDYGIEIKQSFTIEEKLLFIERYIIHVIETCKILSSFQKTEFIYLSTNLNCMIKELSMDDMSIEMLKIFIENMVYDYICLKRSYLQEIIILQDPWNTPGTLFGTLITFIIICYSKKKFWLPFTKRILGIDIIDYILYKWF